MKTMAAWLYTLFLVGLSFFNWHWRPVHRGENGRLSGAIPTALAGGGGGASGTARWHGASCHDAGRAFHTPLGAARPLADLDRSRLWCDRLDPQLDYT